MKKNFTRIFSLALLVAAAVTMGGCDAKLFSKSMAITPEAAKVKIEKFINDNLMTPGSKATIDKIVEENGLYKMSINIGSGQIIDSYATKNGEIFFPNALNIKEIEAQQQGSNTTPDTSDATVPQDLPKTAKPVVELFVMSHCPYGTQIEKGIVPVIEALKGKADIQIKFCDYAMHGDKELKEELNQYCIQKEQSAKYVSYLKCFLDAGDSEACLTSSKIDKTKLNSCVAKTDKQFNVTAGTEKKGSYPVVNLFKDDNAKYNVGGSPTLVINGVEAQSNRDAASLLTTICSAFENQPSECTAKLDSSTPSAGFGTGTTGSADSANCGS